MIGLFFDEVMVDLLVVLRGCRAAVLSVRIASDMSTPRGVRERMRARLNMPSVTIPTTESSFRRNTFSYRASSSCDDLSLESNLELKYPWYRQISQHYIHGLHA